jgi:DNA-binding winged helix-turn-helix (wHTH) protein
MPGGRPQQDRMYRCTYRRSPSYVVALAHFFARRQGIELVGLPNPQTACQNRCQGRTAMGDCVDASSQPRRDVWRVGDLVIDEGQQLVMRGDEVIELPKLSFDLLIALVRSAPDVVSIDSLLTRVWPGVVVSQETVVQRVKMLREALNDRAAEPRYIMALRMRGYRLVAAVSKTEAPDGFRITPKATPEPVGPPPQPAAEARPEARQPNRRLFAILAAAALVLIVALGLWALRRHVEITGAGH